MRSLYYSNGAPTHCALCGGRFAEADGHLVAIHTELGYFCCHEHADSAAVVKAGRIEQLARLQ
jgi:hypothetical protein